MRPSPSWFDHPTRIGFGDQRVDDDRSRLHRGPACGEYRRSAQPTVRRQTCCAVTGGARRTARHDRRVGQSRLQWTHHDLDDQVGAQAQWMALAAVDESLPLVQRDGLPVGGRDAESDGAVSRVPGPSRRPPRSAGRRHPGPASPGPPTWRTGPATCGWPGAGAPKARPTSRPPSSATITTPSAGSARRCQTSSGSASSPSRVEPNASGASASARRRRARSSRHSDGRNRLTRMVGSLGTSRTPVQPRRRPPQGGPSATAGAPR